MLSSKDKQIKSIGWDDETIVKLFFTREIILRVECMFNHELSFSSNMHDSSVLLNYTTYAILRHFRAFVRPVWWEKISIQKLYAI